MCSQTESKRNPNHCWTQSWFRSFLFVSSFAAWPCTPTRMQLYVMRHKRNVCFSRAVLVCVTFEHEEGGGGGGPVLFFTNLSWLLTVIGSTWESEWAESPLGVGGGGNNNVEQGGLPFFSWSPSCWPDFLTIFACAHTEPPWPKYFPPLSPFNLFLVLHSLSESEWHVVRAATPELFRSTEAGCLLWILICKVLVLKQVRTGRVKTTVDTTKRCWISAKASFCSCALSGVPNQSSSLWRCSVSMRKRCATAPLPVFTHQ